VWAVRTETDDPVARELARAAAIHPLVARVLAARGVSTAGEASSFLSPRLAELTQPDGMADRDAAAERIDAAINRHERIVVFGDYDVDGTTSAALLTDALGTMGADITALVASRFEGGYGLSDAALVRVLERRPGLVITCDCGTSDHARIAALRARGIDTVVVDHHKVPDDPLPAIAFLNPNRPDCRFPFKGLASVGLALSIAAAVRARRNAKLDLRTYLDLVAVGTIADVAPLQSDNRVLTRVGLDRLAGGLARPGVLALVREARLRGKMRAFDVGFSIGPLLNAPGRLASAEPTLALLLARTSGDAEPLVAQLTRANVERRQISQDLIDRGDAQVRAVYGSDLPAGLVVSGEGWHPGVGGIVAGRLAERFDRPVIVVAIDGDVGVGSARGPKGFALFGAIQACAPSLEQFGGHDGAAGMRMRASAVDALRASFAAGCAAIPRSASLERTADTELQESDLDGELVAHLHTLEPTGASHPEPLVVARGLRVSGVRDVGVAHLRARALVGRRGIGLFARDGVARRARGSLDLRDGTLDVLGFLRPDAWAGPDAVQLDVVETRAT